MFKVYVLVTDLCPMIFLSINQAPVLGRPSCWTRISLEPVTDLFWKYETDEFLFRHENTLYIRSLYRIRAWVWGPIFAKFSSLKPKHFQVTCADPNSRSAYFWNYPSPPNTNCQAAPGPFPELIVVVCQPDGTFQYLGDTIGAFICQVP